MQPLCRTKRAFIQGIDFKKSERQTSKREAMKDRQQGGTKERGQSCRKRGTPRCKGNMEFTHSRKRQIKQAECLAKALREAVQNHNKEVHR